MPGRLIGGLLALLLLPWACSPVTPRPEVPVPATTAPLTAGETIAGEIMAYLMEVVLGRAGPPAKRADWAGRGTDLPLSLDRVKARMHGPIHKRAGLMVLDTNILGLTRVLYHYDPRLNLFKGRLDHDSLYPCAELMALRLLLLRKLARDEGVSLAAIRRHRAQFMNPTTAIDAPALAAMNLSETEFHFMGAVFRSEPAFLQYMQHPFIVSTLKRIGVATPDTAAPMADLTDSYRPWACPPAATGPATLTVAILPSMTAMFDVPAEAGGPVTPTPEFQRLIGRLQAAIRAGRQRRMANGNDTVDRPLRFWTPGRPMAVHPQNAGRMIEIVCPDADFTVILLGKNVYRALFIDPDRDIYPHERRLYLDVDDIRYQNLDETADRIAGALAAVPTP